MITLSSTIVRHLLKSGDVKDYCPFQVKKLMDGEYELSGEAIQFGLFFETIALGKGLRGSKVEDLPRKKNGEKRVTQLRIESQAEKFKELCVKYGIIIAEENTQVTIWKKLSEGVFLQGNLDICPVGVNDPRYGNTLGIIDLKLTKNLDNTFGDYAWAVPHLIDMIQSQIYLYLVEDLDLELNSHLPKEIFEIVARRGKEFQFYYWIFEHSPPKNQSLRNKIMPVEKNALRRMEMLESLRKAYKLIKYHEESGWDKRKVDCERCPVTECDYNPSLRTRL